MKTHLFPHSYLPGATLKKIVSLFGPARLYQPWHMDSTNGAGNAGLEIINPPETMKPGTGIKAILSNYRQWVDQNRDRGIREFLKFSEKTNVNDNSTWEIKKLLKTSTLPASQEKPEETILKWHILLHLAHEVERQEFEVRDMMKALKGKGAVLAGALQDADETKNLLDDMPGLSPTDIQDSINIGLVLTAWFGLFSGYLEKNDVLITLSSRAMDYISAQWDDAFQDDRAANPETVSFKLPEADDRLITTMRRLISDFGNDPVRGLNGLKELAGESGELQKSSDDASCISLKHFPAREVEIKGDSILKHISGKTIILFPPQ
jgi:hypothetical protein